MNHECSLKRFVTIFMHHISFIKITIFNAMYKGGKGGERSCTTDLKWQRACVLKVKLLPHIASGLDG